MTVTPFQKPSPDWDMVTIAWAGTLLDGSPAKGSLEIRYDGGGPMLDDDPTMPLTIFGIGVSVPIQETTVIIGGEPRAVGYVSMQIPASNDPDIIGGGGTYTVTEKLNRGGGRAVTFVADKDAPSPIWVNKLAGTAVNPGEPVSIIYYSDFTELEDRVAVLESTPSASSWTDLADTFEAGDVLTGGAIYSNTTFANPEAVLAHL